MTGGRVTAERRGELLAAIRERQAEMARLAAEADRCRWRRLRARRLWEQWWVLHAANMDDFGELGFPRRRWRGEVH